MVEFKSLAAVAGHPFASPRQREAVLESVRRLAEGLHSPEAPYNPEAEGWVVLLEPGDGEDVLSPFTRCPLRETPWEGAVRDARTGCIVACVCTSNSFALTVVVPEDGTFLPPAARARLLEEIL